MKTLNRQLAICQSQPGSATFPLSFSGELGVAVKDAIQFVVRNSIAGITNGKSDKTAVFKKSGGMAA